MIRAATSISLNVAEGSTGQTDLEQAGFLGMAVRSLIETVACHQIIKRRGYIQDEDLLQRVYDKSQTLVRKLQSFRKSISQPGYQTKEESASYFLDDQTLS